MRKRWEDFLALEVKAFRALGVEVVEAKMEV